MSKRSAKKRIVTAIAAAIDQLVISTGSDDNKFDEKTDQLFALYDTAMTRINNTYKIKDRSAVKAHYNQLYADMQAGIIEIIGKN